MGNKSSDPNKFSSNKFSDPNENKMYRGFYTEKNIECYCFLQTFRDGKVELLEIVHPDKAPEGQEEKVGTFVVEVSNYNEQTRSITVTGTEFSHLITGLTEVKDNGRLIDNIKQNAANAEYTLMYQPLYGDNVVRIQVKGNRQRDLSQIKDWGDYWLVDKGTHEVGIATKLEAKVLEQADSREEFTSTLRF